MFVLQFTLSESFVVFILQKRSDSLNNFSDPCKIYKDLLYCRWIQAVEIATSLSATEQEQLCEVCQYLNEAIKKKSFRGHVSYVWLALTKMKRQKYGTKTFSTFILHQTRECKGQEKGNENGTKMVKAQNSVYFVSPVFSW